MISIILFLCILLRAVSSQSLVDAISAYQQLTNFGSLLAANPNLIPNYNSSQKVTILIPSNTAFASYLASTGNSINSLSDSTITSIAQYHTLDGIYTSKDLNHTTGLLANTLLKDDVYNHRNSSDGQVVFISAGTAGPGQTLRLAVRQTDSAAGTNVTSGEGNVVDMTQVDGIWSGGMFQIVNGFLTLPKTCTSTMADKKDVLSSLQDSLVRTNLTDVLNNFANVTCLAPNNAAFSSAGSPDVNLNTNLLANALKFHTIAGAQYTTLVRDGLILTAVNGDKIQVGLRGGKLYFNDAMVLQSNVITNNGVIHVLDKIMSPLNSTATSTSASASATSTGASGTSNNGTTVSGTAAPPNASSSLKPSSASGDRLSTLGTGLFVWVAAAAACIFLYV